MSIYFYSPDKQYGEFSNFWSKKQDKRFRLTIDGEEWKTTEHYFQAQKFTKFPEYQRVIKEASGPGMAAFYGRQVTKPSFFVWTKKAVEVTTVFLEKGVVMDSDWEDRKIEVMDKALYAKFSQNEHLKALLLSTEPNILVEHTSVDSYWGDGRDGKGLNRLGGLLMGLRTRFGKY